MDNTLPLNDNLDFFNRNMEKGYASKTSSALFTMVAESMVIFLPIDQLGCFKASSFFFSFISSFVRPKKGPPEAVKMSFDFFRLFSS